MKTIQKLTQEFRNLVEDSGLHGLYFQHIVLCRRRAWLHLMCATHVNRSPRARRELALHQVDKRSNNLAWGLGIAPDDLDFSRCVVIEKKGGDGAQEAVSKQALFYAAIMSAATGTLWKAEISIYGKRNKLVYELTRKRLLELIQDARESKILIENPCPNAKRIPLCSSCSCKLLCWNE